MICPKTAERCPYNSSCDEINLPLNGVIGEIAATVKARRQDNRGPRYPVVKRVLEDHIDGLGRSLLDPVVPEFGTINPTTPVVCFGAAIENGVSTNTVVDGVRGAIYATKTQLTSARIL